MYIAVLRRIAGIQVSDYPWNGTFTGVAADAYYAPYIAWAAENHIAEGVGNSSFDPNGLVTREQMSVFTVRFFDVLGIDIGESDETGEDPKDLSEVSDWAKDSVLRLWRAGILKGDENGSFNPRDNANRAEGAAISMRVHQKKAVWSEEHPSSTPESDSDNDDRGGETASSYTVSFQTNGGAEISAMTVSRGGTIPDLPTPQKMGFVFLGWYTDAAFTEEFTSETAVTSNLTLYAKYAELESVTSMEDERFALTDQATTLSFTLLSSSMDQSDVEDAVTLERSDGSTAEDLSVTAGTGDNFTVTADGGFTAGAAYTLTLDNDALAFSGRGESFRECDFTIRQEESDNLPLSSDIIYIPADELSDIIKNGETVSSLSVPLVSDENITSITGSFTYGGSETLSVGDTLCVYSGNTPPDIDANSEDLLDTDIAYVDVAEVNGATVSYTQADAENVLALPDTLPIYVGDGSLYAGYSPSGTSFTVDTEDVDFSQYTSIGLDAQTTIDIGDYLFFYTNPNFAALTESDVLGYAVVTNITSNGSNSITVTYETTAQEEMQSDTYYYARTPVSGGTLLGDTGVELLEDSLEQQAMDSGFAREAALYLCAVTMETDGFEETLGESASPSSDSLSLMSADNDIDIDVSAHIGTDTQKIGRGGVRAAVTVSFEVPVAVGDNDMVISGSATFVQELSVSIDASGNFVWNHWWIFYWISDYNVSTYTNVYNYTGMFVEASIRSQDNGVSLDVSDEIQELLASTDSAEIVSGVADLLNTYCGLMENGSDWIELFDKELFDKRIAVLFGIIQIKISGDFVVSAYINVALGSNFEYWIRYNENEPANACTDRQKRIYL